MASGADSARPRREELPRWNTANVGNGFNIRELFPLDSIAKRWSSVKSPVVDEASLKGASHVPPEEKNNTVEHGERRTRFQHPRVVPVGFHREIGGTHLREEKNGGAAL